MPPSNNAVQVTITAKNESSQVLNQFGREFNEVARATRTAAGDFLQVINPAFANFAGAMTNATREAKTLSVGMGTMLVGATALGTGLSVMATLLREAAARQAQLNESVRTFQPGPLLSNIQDLKREMAELKALEESGFLGRIVGGIQRGIVGLGGLTGLGRGAPDAEIQRQRLAYEQAAGPGRESERLGLAADLARLEQQRAALYGTPAQQYAAIQEIMRDQQRQAEIAKDLAIKGGPGTMGFRKQQEALFAGRSRILGQTADLQQRQIADAIFEKYFQGAGADQMVSGQGFEQVSAGMAASSEIDISRAQVIAESIRREIIATIINQPQLENADVFGGGAEQVGVGPTPAETRAGAVMRQQRDVQQAETARDLFDVKKAYVGLTIEEREQLEKISIEMQRQVDLAAAGDHSALQELADARAAMAQINLELTRMERTDPLAGLARGFKDVAQEATSTGRIMQDFARQTASSMQRSFSDLFFDVMTGNFRDLANVGKNFAASLARDVSDSLARQITGSIFGGISSLFPGPSFFGNAGNAGILSGSQQLTLQQLLAQLQQDAARPKSDLFTSIADLFRSSPQAGSPGGGFGIGAGEGEGGGGLFGGGGGFDASSISGAGAGSLFALVGFAIGSSGDKHDQRVGQGIALGAGIGGQVGGVFGAGVGAIVGLAAAVATQDVKDEEDVIKSGVRRGDAADIKRLTPLLDRDIADVKAALTYPDLAAAIRQSMHGAYGGPQDRGAGRHGSRAGWAVFIDGTQVILPGGKYSATMTLDEFAAALRDKGETFSAALQMGLSESNLRQINDAYTQAVRNQVDAIRTFGGSPIAFQDVGPGLSRTTLIAAGSLDDFPGAAGHQLYIDRRPLQRAGWTDEQIDTFIRSIADRNTQTDRFPDLPRDVRLML
jgi:hypothetical protein